MRRGDLAPVFMGGAMGLMGLGMLHGQLTGTGSGMGGLAFVLAHLAVAVTAVGLVVFGLHRRFAWIARLLAHRPSGRHLGVMLLAALATAALFHLLHGTPSSWT